MPLGSTVSDLWCQFQDELFPTVIPAHSGFNPFAGPKRSAKWLHPTD